MVGGGESDDGSNYNSGTFPHIEPGQQPIFFFSYTDERLI